jgi:hypothetical protein
VPTSYVPIFIWPALTGTNSPNNNYYSVTISRAGTDYQTFLTYVPLNNLTNMATEYLFVYSYQQFIDAINVALNASFIAAGGSATAPPYLIYNNIDGIISIVAQYAYANTNAEYEIFMNFPLYSFFNNFKSIRNGYNNTNGKDVQLFIENEGDNDYIGHPPGYPLATADDSYVMGQEYNSLYNWYDIRSIILTSLSMPVRREALNIKNTTTPASNSSYRSILTDFEPEIQSGNNTGNVRSYLQYSPRGEYRLIDMTSETPLQTTDLQIYFETSDQTLYPLKLEPGEYVSVKIMFRNKLVKSGL